MICFYVSINILPIIYTLLDDIVILVGFLIFWATPQSSHLNDVLVRLGQDLAMANVVGYNWL